MRPHLMAAIKHAMPLLLVLTLVAVWQLAMWHAASGLPISRGARLPDRRPAGTACRSRLGVSRDGAAQPGPAGANLATDQSARLDADGRSLVRRGRCRAHLPAPKINPSATSQAER